MLIIDKMLKDENKFQIKINIQIIKQSKMQCPVRDVQVLESYSFFFEIQI